MSEVDNASTQLTKEELDKIGQLKEATTDLTKPSSFDREDDLFYKRWLIARDWNVKKAELMLRKSMEFRQQHKVDSLTTTYTAPDVLEHYYVGGVSGFDREGSPIWVDPFTLLDSRGLLHSVTKEQVKLHKVYTCEKLLELFQEQSGKLDRPVGQIVIVFDMANLSWSHVWPPGLECYKEVIAIFEDNYPEMLKKTYVINAPRIFVLVYNLIKSVITKRTADKVHVIGSHWKDVLLQDIDADQLPVHYGGTQTGPDNDPKCTHKVKYGGVIPKKYYSTNDDISVDMMQISIPRGSREKIEYQISLKNCQIVYKLKTEKHDIGFGFVYKPSHSDITKIDDMTVILPIQRVNTHTNLHQGTVDCEEPGVYTLILDNTFSWTRGKDVYYSVEIECKSGDSFSSALEVPGNDDTVDNLINS